MELNQLIRRLEALKARHGGDVPVILYNSEQDHYNFDYEIAWEDWIQTPMSDKYRQAIVLRTGWL